MLYSILKRIARLALPIFCRKIIINKPEVLKIKGPVLLACNHPNSFLDSIIIDTLFEETVWSLARGDAFKNPFIKILAALKILPVYRPSEGVENLSENYKTFDACIEILKNNGVITIFSEGKCINEWHLRSLKKGTARLAIKAWEENIPLTVIPVGLNYSSFTRFGKNVFINFGEPMQKEDMNFNVTDGLRHQEFNNLLQRELEHSVFEIQKKDKQTQKEQLEIKPSSAKNILLILPAAIGYLIHLPLYLPIKKYIWKRTHDNDHYDSIMAGIMMLSYPIYLLLLITISWLITSCWWVIGMLLVLPFTAWSYIQLKPQIDK
ncbi:MAG: 1-acyl-sn-glycerol-3-phosphate acyltransferase [Chitinophagaceae bacterium]|nr:1-acyl-sn-glycerol-3-phosphate acyltransferase [Chitinophagaceae bacterium]